MIGLDLFAATVAFAGFWILCGIIDRPHRASPHKTWELFERRRDSVAALSPTYRWFGPLVDELAVSCLCRSALHRWLAKRQLQLSLVSPFRPEEMLGLIALHTVAIGGVVFGAAAIVFSLSWGASMGYGLTTAAMYAAWSLRKISKQASRYAEQFVARLPFALDIVAMLLDVGENLPEALHIVGTHGTGVLETEFTEFSFSLSRGSTLRQAIDQMRSRSMQVDVRDALTTLITASDLGAPLSDALRDTATRLREKRVQTLEAAAAEASVAIQFPAFLIMLSCFNVVMLPFVVPAVRLLLK